MVATFHDPAGARTMAAQADALARRMKPCRAREFLADVAEMMRCVAAPAVLHDWQAAALRKLASAEERYRKKGIIEAPRAPKGVHAGTLAWLAQYGLVSVHEPIRVQMLWPDNTRYRVTAAGHLALSVHQNRRRRSAARVAADERWYAHVLADLDQRRAQLSRRDRGPDGL